MMTPIRVLLVDDHELFRAGMRSLLERSADLIVVGEAHDGRDALSLIKECRPDVVLMDILMPELNGLDATARIAAKFPAVRVIILSMTVAEEYVLSALRAGAAGYVVKHASPAELELAIKAVARGETFLSSLVSKHVMEAYLKHIGRPEDSAAEQDESSERLTSRQREVLQLVAEGSRTKEIARKLQLSVKTVEMHRAQIMARLAIHDVAGLARYAIRIGLITAER